jgi:hypothetical protein
MLSFYLEIKQPSFGYTDYQRQLQYVSVGVISETLSITDVDTAEKINSNAFTWIKKKYVFIYYKNLTYLNLHFTIRFTQES